MAGASWPVLGQRTEGSSGEQHLDLRPSENSAVRDALRAAEAACQVAIQQIPQVVEMSQALLIYPEGEGEGDAVTITERDMAELRPGSFLGNNIVDFYIRFLERGLSREHGNRFYFFNSFFFTKLLQSTVSTGIDPCKVDYEQLRKWTKEVDLFARDYVFIPILKSSHWSLLIICHLSHLTRPPGETRRSPCVFHLDPIEGQHESFEGLIRSYVLQAWMGRFEASSNSDQLLALCQMQYVQAKVPQQANSHDCGLYVLNYIKAFLKKSTSSAFSFISIEMGLDFLCSHFEPEVLVKRRHIQNCINELSVLSQKRTQKRKAVQEVLRSTRNLQSLLSDEGNSDTCIKAMHTSGPSLSNGQGFEIIEDGIVAQHQQPGLMSKVDNESVGGLQIGDVEYENRSDSISPKRQHVEYEEETIGAINFNGPHSEATHVSTHEDSIDAEHPQTWLNGPKLQHIEYQRGSKRFLEQQCESREIPCTDLSNDLKGKSKKNKMTEDQTWLLLSCKLEGGCFCKGNRGATHWNLISEEIGKKLGSLLSPDQCRLRYDTLLKAYKTYKKYCMKTSKTFSEITTEERLDLKLSTTLNEEWYSAMDEIVNKANTFQKRMKLSPTARNDFHILSSLVSTTRNLLPISQGVSFEGGPVVLDGVCGIVEVALHNVFSAKVLSSMNEDLQSTLLNLVQECYWDPIWEGKKYFDLEEICRRLSILQDCKSRDIMNYVLKLWQLELVHVEGMVYKRGMDLLPMNLLKHKIRNLKVCLYEKIVNKVLCKNPHLKTYCDSFPVEQSSLQYIRVLNLVECEDLEHLDLREFPSLQCLTIKYCPKFHSVTGWEVATGLGSIEISCCNAYCDFPGVQYLFSLREIKIYRSIWSLINAWQFSDFNQCTKLWRLDIWNDLSLSEIVDLETLKELKSLEFLALHDCAFSSIQGLSGLQALRTLKLIQCTSLRRVPELGCLKGLTELDMSWSSIEDVVGVGELHLLTSLDLKSCTSLKWLPFLGNLKALVYLNITCTGVKEIPGKEDLISLKTLLGI